MNVYRITLNILNCNLVKKKLFEYLVTVLDTYVYKKIILRFLIIFILKNHKEYAWNF